MTDKPTWRDKAKASEQAFMIVKDQYAELAQALGFEGDAFFGDPLATHAEVLARASHLFQSHRAVTLDEGAA